MLNAELWFYGGDEFEPVEIQPDAFVIDDFDDVFAFLEIKKQRLLMVCGIKFLEIVLSIVAPAARVGKKDGSAVVPSTFTIRLTPSTILQQVLN